MSNEPRNLIRFWICVVVGVALWFTPPPAGLSIEGWHVFAVFAATIVSFLLRPLPMGACVLIGLLVLGATGTISPSPEEEARKVLGPNAQVDFKVVQSKNPEELTVFAVAPEDTSRAFMFTINRPTPAQRVGNSFKSALSGFADDTVWLVVAAFFLSGAMIHSELGKRLALMMISALGRTTLGLGYAIAAAELVLAPFIPSNTARGGGLMMPIVNSISNVLGSHPHDQPKRAGEFLVLCGAHANLISAAMFLTGMAANPLVAAAARDFLNQDFGWAMWLKGSIVPGLLSFALLPLLLYWIARPQLTNSCEARDAVRSDLTAMGPWTSQQIVMACVFLAMLVIWATGPLQENYLNLKLPTALVALGGVVTLVVLGVLPYEKVTGNAGAWDALLWLGGLVSMADALRATKFVDWFATQVQNGLGETSGIAAAIVLALIYYYSMYAFSMLTGHILAFAGVFFTVAAAAGAPPLVMIALIAYFSNLSGSITNYSTGPVVIYFNLGYVSVARWFWVGLCVSLFHMAVWLGGGLLWWKWLGWW